jgi:hypothetical protein
MNTKALFISTIALTLIGSAIVSYPKTAIAGTIEQLPDGKYTACVRSSGCFRFEKTDRDVHGYFSAYGEDNVCIDGKVKNNTITGTAGISGHTSGSRSFTSDKFSTNQLIPWGNDKMLQVGGRSIEILERSNDGRLELNRFSRALLNLKNANVKETSDIKLPACGRDQFKSI